MANVLKSIFGSRNDRLVKSVQPLVKQINALEPDMQKLSDAELRGKTEEFRKRLNDGATLDSLLPEAFAVVREASVRTLGMRPFDVQLTGGIFLHKGYISEMKTGEGKTLMATMPVYLNALEGKGVHVVTVNDYLARRDAEWMGTIYAFLGMQAGFIVHGLSDAERRDAYQADITYATNNELGFDYLRDNMKFSIVDLVQRELNFAIVDEVDSILIDEARTPLIISGPTEDRTELYRAADLVIPKLKEEIHWQKDEKLRQVSLTEEGMDEAERLLKKAGVIQAEEGLYDIDNVAVVHHLNQALKAYTLFQRDSDYIVKDGKVVIIDEFTGRMMPGRRYSEGLHQALEAKERAEIQNENQTLASITFQNYFRMYNKLAGMTGTADTEAEEFEGIYGLQVAIVPTNVPVQRMDEPDVIYRTVEEKYRAIVRDIKSCAEKGQPVLVGTTSIDKSEKLSERLKQEGIKHNVLNARYHEQEAEIVAQAGRYGAVTIATNMAGRGTDIKLGGNIDLLLAEAEGEKDQPRIKAEYEAEKAKVMEAGGLRIIGTERHESRRIDNQLRGRSGRQGDVGSSIFFLSLQDDLMRIFAPNMDQMMERLNMQEDEAIQSRLVSRAIEAAQRKIEARNFDMRKNLLKFDDVHNEQRKVIYEQRRDIMASEEVSDIIEGFREDVLEQTMARILPPDSFPEQWDIPTLSEEIFRIFNVKAPIAEWAAEEGTDQHVLHEKLLAHIHAVYAEKEKRLTAALLRRLEKSLLLQVLDQQWKDHLQRLDYLREGINLRGFAQKDPLNEYKSEAFVMFEAMLGHIREETLMYLSHVEVRETPQEPLTGEPGAPEPAMATAEGSAQGNPYASMNLSRNDACPCGSGRKYKHCHGKLKAAPMVANGH